MQIKGAICILHAMSTSYQQKQIVRQSVVFVTKEYIFHQVN